MRRYLDVTLCVILNHFFVFPFYVLQCYAFVAHRMIRAGAKLRGFVL